MSIELLMILKKQNFDSLGLSLCRVISKKGVQAPKHYT